MIVSVIPKQVFDLELFAVIGVRPTLTLNVARRGPFNAHAQKQWEQYQRSKSHIMALTGLPISEKGEIWTISYCGEKDDPDKTVVLLRNTSKAVTMVEILYSELYTLTASHPCVGKLKEFASLWGTTLEDLCDHIFVNSPWRR